MMFGLNPAHSFNPNHVVLTLVFFGGMKVYRISWTSFGCGHNASSVSDQSLLDSILRALLTSPRGVFLPSFLGAFLTAFLGSFSTSFPRSGSHMVRRAGVIPSMVPPTWPGGRRHRGSRCRGPSPQTDSRTKPNLPAGARTSPCLCNRSVLGR